MMFSHKKSTKALRVGIYAGTFDPVHAGHIAFALQAMQTASLDEIVFLPERKPRFKDGPEHFGHRVAMLKRATKPYAKFSVMETVDKHFTVRRTLPQLQSTFRGAQLVFLVGSDVAEHMSDWAGIEQLCRTSELVVGVRSGQSTKLVRDLLRNLPVQPQTYVFESYAATISSGKIRDAIRGGNSTHGLLKSVTHYARNNWLYASLQ